MNSELPPLTIDGIPVSVDKMTQVSRLRGCLQAHPVVVWLQPQGMALISDLCPPGLEQLLLVVMIFSVTKKKKSC